MPVLVTAGKLAGVDIPATAAPRSSPLSDALPTPASSDALPTPASSDALPTPASSDALPTPASSDALPTAPEAGAIEVRVNGSATCVPDDLSVQQLVARWCPSPDGVAVARNREVVPRSLWPATTLHPGDEVEIVTAVAGG